MWQDQSSSLAARSLEVVEQIGKTRSLTLDHEAMAALLLQTTSGDNIQARSINTLSVEVPLPDGSNVTVALEKTDLLPTQLSSAYPSIQTYKVTQPVGLIVSGRVDFTSHGFHALLHTRDGQTLLVDPEEQGNLGQYVSYAKADLFNDQPYQCSTPEAHDHASFSPIQARSFIAARSSSGGIVEYKIAVAATAEYTQAQGGTVEDALSAIVTSLSRVNNVYEHSLGVRFKLVENNDLLIYTNTSTDPYTNYQIEDLLNENQINIDQVIGSDNYDIGHVFGTSGGGLAYISSLCNESSKAKGASGISRPYGEFFNIDFVAHELGHQLGATHTFNADQGICTSGARTASTAFEPGSGSTIMSYAGGCGTDDVQAFADSMFHSGNIQQIRQNITTGAANACGVHVSHDNLAPVVFAGTSHSIPANTPFELTATASDIDDDSLLYSWDQLDAGSSSSIDLDTGDNPLFRVLPATAKASRSFPALTTLLGGTALAGETLPSTDRKLNFQVSVYDSYNSPSMDQVQLNIVNTGKTFTLENHAEAYATGAQSTIYWESANTQDSPINCATVDLNLSTDNGGNFDYLIADSIPNNGVASVYIPSEIPNSSSGRFKLSCSDNVFFSLSASAFSLNSDASLVEINTRSTNTATTNNPSSASGGGSTPPLFAFTTLLLFLLRKQYFTK
ncbi:reprolysin-like metallopeptidase [Leucothrix arctica]|nr:zinc-dependent metalloprotease family protein [Leucothrix arctica]